MAGKWLLFEHSQHLCTQALKTTRISVTPAAIQILVPLRSSITH
jgi:hypothetical protein